MNIKMFFIAENYHLDYENGSLKRYSNPKRFFYGITKNLVFFFFLFLLLSAIFIFKNDQLCLRLQLRMKCEKCLKFQKLTFRP